MSAKYMFLVNEGDDQLLLLMTKDRALSLADMLLNVHQKWDEGQDDFAYLALRGGLAKKVRDY